VAALLALPVLALATAAKSADNGAEAEAAAQYKKGATSYRKRCARCHGANMVNPGPGIFDLRTFPRDDKARFVNAVVNGKNAMPSWGDVLDADGVDALWVYVTQ
jgi:LSD1 subclass zinc finger protein